MTTQAPELVKLKLVGASLCMNVQKAELVPVGKYPEYAFVGFDSSRQRAVELRVPQKSADRQLARLALTLADTVGLTLLFSRGENAEDASKPYWNIERASGAKGPSGASNGAAAVGGQQAASEVTPTATTPPAPPNGEEKQSALYLRMTQWAITDIVPLYVSAGIPVTMEGVAAVVATNFIQKNKH